MQPNTPHHDAVLVKKVRNSDKLYASVFIAALAFFVVQHLVWHPHIIGHHTRYLLYVFTLPVCAGVVFFGLVMRNYLGYYLADANTAARKLVAYPLCALVMFFYSYLTFGVAAGLVWKYLHQQAAKESPVEIQQYPVEKFYGGRRSAIWFTFQDKPEKLDVTQRYMQRFTQGAGSYVVELKLRRGLWDYYTVDSWEVRLKQGR